MAFRHNVIFKRGLVGKGEAYAPTSKANGTALSPLLDHGLDGTELEGRGAVGDISTCLWETRSGFEWRFDLGIRGAFWGLGSNCWLMAMGPLGSQTIDISPHGL